MSKKERLYKILFATKKTITSHFSYLLIKRMRGIFSKKKIITT